MKKLKDKCICSRRFYDLPKIGHWNFCSLNSQKIINPSGSILSDEATNDGSSTISADFTVTQYLVQVFTLANSSDTISSQFLRTWHNR